ncbi:hypothetical protein [Streptomonospora salina]|uniref:Uncharacterized protein n=1 Tax=Streptomonospora salina TaxID=104205 RepID=A0A841ELQ9_9ACTN|nr:hypothetical protein [Streptomonospora salina]MBB6001240.1 hypothetical protein [Streptomonospora salina]
MTAIPYAQLGPGGHDPHGCLNHRFGAVWRIRCDLSPDGQYWIADRYERAPADAAAHGVCDRHAGWMRPAELWRWLQEEETAWHRWNTGQPPTTD